MNSLILNLALLQVGLPLLLVVAHCLIPGTSRLALVLRTAALLTLLNYAALAGIWLFPPWWTPYLLMIFSVFGTIFHWPRTKARGRRWLQITEPVLAILVGIGGSFALLPVYEGRNIPASAIDLAMPIGPCISFTGLPCWPLVMAPWQMWSVASPICQCRKWTARI